MMTKEDSTKDLPAEAANRLRNDVQRDAAKARASDNGDPFVSIERDAEETESQTRDRHHDAF